MAGCQQQGQRLTEFSSCESLICSCQICYKVWVQATLTICLFPAPIKSLKTSLPGELRLAPHAPSPGWLAFQSYYYYMTQAVQVVLHGSNVPEGVWLDLEGLAGSSGAQDLGTPALGSQAGQVGRNRSQTTVCIFG